MKNTFLPITTLVILAGLISNLARADVSQSTLDGRLIRSQETFHHVLQSKMGAIPPGVLAQARGILIYREYGAGFWLGGKGGFGLAMQRMPSGAWGPPAFLKMGECNFGLQIGVQRLDVVFLFMNRDSLRVFDDPRFRLGVDVAAAAGPVGANAEAKIGAPVLVYSDTRGLYAGAAFEGAMLMPDEPANEAFYGIPGVSVSDILTGRALRHFPAAAEGLRRQLVDYERNGPRPGYHFDHPQPAPEDRPYDRDLGGGRRN